jgi:hypothetical protein
MRIAYLLTGLLALGCVGGQTGEGEEGFPYCDYDKTDPVSVELGEATALGFTPANVVAYVSDRKSGAAPSRGEEGDGAVPEVGLRFTPGTARFRGAEAWGFHEGAGDSCPGFVEVDGSVELELRDGERTVKAVFDATAEAYTGAMVRMKTIVPAAQVTGDDVELGVREWVDRYEVEVIATAAGWSGRLVRMVRHVDEGDDPANPFAPSLTERKDAAAAWPSDVTCATTEDLLVPVPADGDLFGVPLADLSASRSFETSLKWFDYGSSGPAPTTVSLDVAPKGGFVCLSPTCWVTDLCQHAPTSDVPPTDHVFVGTPVTVGARTESSVWNHDLDAILWSEVSRRGEVVGHWMYASEEYDDAESLRAETGIEVEPDGATSIDFSLDLQWPAYEGGAPAPWGSFVVWGYKSDAGICTEMCTGFASKQLAGANIGTKPPMRR